jgi:hypothetical protein
MFALEPFALASHLYLKEIGGWYDLAHVSM